MVFCLAVSRNVGNEACHASQEASPAGCKGCYEETRRCINCGLANGIADGDTGQCGECLGASAMPPPEAVETLVPLRRSASQPPDAMEAASTVGAVDLASVPVAVPIPPSSSPPSQTRPPQQSVPPPPRQDVEPYGHGEIPEEVGRWIAALNDPERKALQMRFGIGHGRRYGAFEMAIELRCPSPQVARIIAAGMGQLEILLGEDPMVFHRLQKTLEAPLDGSSVPTQPSFELREPTGGSTSKGVTSRSERSRPLAPIRRSSRGRGRASRTEPDGEFTRDEETNVREALGGGGDVISLGLLDEQGMGEEGDGDVPHALEERGARSERGSEYVLAPAAPASSPTRPRVTTRTFIGEVDDRLRQLRDLFLQATPSEAWEQRWAEFAGEQARLVQGQGTLLQLLQELAVMAIPMEAQAAFEARLGRVEAELCEMHGLLKRLVEAQETRTAVAAVPAAPVVAAVVSAPPASAKAARVVRSELPQLERPPSDPPQPASQGEGPSEERVYCAGGEHLLVENGPQGLTYGSMSYIARHYGVTPYRVKKHAEGAVPSVRTCLARGSAGVQTYFAIDDFADLTAKAAE